MKSMSISEARNQLPTVVEEVAQSREACVVTRYGTPLVTIVPYTDSVSAETRYPLRGRPVAVADNFDQPMPDLWSALAVAEKHAAYTTPKPRAKR